MNPKTGKIIGLFLIIMGIYFLILRFFTDFTSIEHYGDIYFYFDLPQTLGMAFIFLGIFVVYYLGGVKKSLKR